MRRLARLAAHTPPDRERYLDLLRAVAIILVVLGHWAISAVEYDESGRPDGHSALTTMPWAYPLTWAVQVMPVFFLVGGYANAASLAAHRSRGGDAIGWLLGRSARLLRPTSALVLVLAGGALVARLGGAQPDEVRPVVWFATIPLWFLAAYLAVVPLTPVMYALHRRLGLLVPLALVLLVAAGDAGRARGPAGLALPGYLFGWLAVHQLGFAWYDARQGHCRPGGPRSRCLPMSRRAAVAMLLGGLGVAILLTGPGPYPISMINLPGQRLANAAPPSVALLAVATAQLGLILLLRQRTERWLHRDRPWQAVIAVNSVVLTVFLWHLSAAVLLVGALHGLGLLPTPEAGTAAWLAWRLPWVLMLAVVLAVLVAIFGPIEASTGRPRHLRAPARWAGARAALTVAAFAAVVYALAANGAAAKTAPEPLGWPVEALVAYLAGAGTLRLLRSGWGSRD